MSNRFHRTVVIGTVAAISLALIAEASAYRFFRRSVNDSLVPTSEEAARWSPSVWGPSESLAWVVSDSPRWSDPWVYEDEVTESPFASAAEVIPYVRRALEAWTAAPNARIRWSVEGTQRELPRARDHINAVRPHVLDFGGSYAAIFMEDGEIVECDISFSPGHTVLFEGRGLSTLMHEFGHCLGLAHSGMFPTWDASPWRRGREEGLWRQDPKMSYGFRRDNVLTADDIVAAALLRPAPGWRPGGIRGAVAMEGEPARFVRVAATRIEDDGRLGWSVSVFTDGRGEYFLEGLAPGDYLLAAGPMMQSAAHSSLLDAGATMLGAGDHYRLTPIPVSAGSASRAPPIRLRAGRANAAPGTGDPG